MHRIHDGSKPKLTLVTTHTFLLERGTFQIISQFYWRELLLMWIISWVLIPKWKFCHVNSWSRSFWSKPPLRIDLTLVWVFLTFYIFRVKTRFVYSPQTYPTKKRKYYIGQLRCSASLSCKTVSINQVLNEVIFSSLCLYDYSWMKTVCSWWHSANKKSWLKTQCKSKKFRLNQKLIPYFLHLLFTEEKCDLLITVWWQM